MSLPRKKESEISDKEQVNVKIPIKTLVDLDRYRAMSRQKRSDVVVEAIINFLKEKKEGDKYGVQY